MYRKRLVCIQHVCADEHHSPFIDLRARGIDEKQAADLRGRLSTFAEEWDSPEMEMYDDYDRAKSHL